MNIQPTGRTSNFMTIDDIINFYTHTLQHSNNQKSDLDKEENTIVVKIMEHN
jgi:protein tyrosine phosphatase